MPMAESFATGGTVAKKAGRLVQRKKLSPVSRHNTFATLGSMDGAALPVGRRKA